MSSFLRNGVEAIKETSVVFPFFMASLAFIRKAGLGLVDDLCFVPCFQLGSAELLLPLALCQFGVAAF